MGEDWDDIDYDAMIEALVAVIGEHLPRSAETGRKRTSDEYSGDILVSAELRAKLDKMIRLGWSYSQIQDDYTAATDIAGTIFSPTGAYDAWDAEKEEAKLDEMLRTTRNLIRIWHSLHPSISNKMEVASGNMSQKYSRDWSERLIKLGFPYLFSTEVPDLGMIFNVLPKMLERCIKVGKDEIRRGRPLGRRKWQAVTVIANCRDLWHQRTGDKAPKGLAPGIPFENFVRDIFKAMGIKEKPRSAMQSWQAVQSKDENT